MINILLLIVGMVFILIAAMVFCNALEHLGEKLGISEGVTGSIFVAVGTALPEAIIPLIAFFTPLSATQANASFDEVGVGAILGPPLMLSTLSIALMAFSVLAKRGVNGQIRPEKTGLRRDLWFFSFGYALAVLLAVSHNYFHSHLLDIAVVVVLLTSYFIYVLLTIRASAVLVKDGHATEAEDPLYATRWLKLPTHKITIIGQAIVGFVGLVYFAHVFIEGITGAAQALHIPVFLLSVVLIPIATELPEKVNSILWIRKGKDTLAVANITGAMVFQGLLLPVMGILLSDWTLTWDKAISCIATFVAVAWLIITQTGQRHYQVKHFSVSGVIYMVSLTISLWMK
jgi:cation:H+ antiporter